MQRESATLVVIGTGGTIAGTAASAADNVGYRAAQLGVRQLVEALPVLRGQAIEVEQVAQLDSKDMDYPAWRLLAQAVAGHLAREEVAGVVVTHGTDTLEETAYFLQRLLAPAKPVVFAAAMRPASALQADGPQNLLDACTLALEPGAKGVMAVLGGRVHSAWDLRKVHPYRLDAFGSGDAGLMAMVEEGRVRQHRDWPAGTRIDLDPFRLPADPAQWPWVEIVTSHAAARGEMVDMLRAAGVQGIVVAATGNGTLHHVLEAALLQAQAAGIEVLRCSRTLDGCIIDPDPAPVLPSAGALTPVQARVELVLRCLAR